MATVREIWNIIKHKEKPRMKKYEKNRIRIGTGSKRIAMFDQSAGTNRMLRKSQAGTTSSLFVALRARRWTGTFAICDKLLCFARRCKSTESSWEQQRTSRWSKKLQKLAKTGNIWQSMNVMMSYCLRWEEMTHLSSRAHLSAHFWYTNRLRAARFATPI